MARRLAGEPLRPLAAVFRNPDLARVQLAWGAFHVAEWAHLVALAVFAYQWGGTTAVGVVGFARLLPAAVAVPFAALLADRYARARVLLAVHVLRAAALAAAAATLALDGPAPVVFALAAATALVSTAFRPAQWALLPELVRSPRELVAANASSSTLESAATVAGPVVGGVLAAAAGAGAAFGVSAGVSVVAAALVVRVARRSGRMPRRSREAGEVGADLLVGFRTLAEHPEPRLLVGLFGVQTFVRGVLNVLIVVIALELTGMGESGVGFLNGAFGIGGFIGAVLAVMLTGRQRLAGPVLLGLVLWGLPIALVGAAPEALFALLCLAVVGAGTAFSTSRD